MSASLAAGALVEVPVEPTLADGLAGQIDAEAFDIGRHALDEIVTVPEDAIARAIKLLADSHGARVEGAGAAGVTALMESRYDALRFPLVAVVSGGNIDEERWRSLTA